MATTPYQPPETEKSRWSVGPEWLWWIPVLLAPAVIYLSPKLHFISESPRLYALTLLAVGTAVFGVQLVVRLWRISQS